ncbi:hypothetical protein [Nocardioides sp. SYSU DS0663]|uniref:hypothetical protein n=1 Tax=Nocardioides sp. SYSU DS0663 TaxID=3416445 RepID=UPI003F4BA2A6
MDFFRGHATASALGLFVIARYLSDFPEGRTEESLRESLQMLKPQGAGSDDSGPVLAASLAVGQGVRILERDQASGRWRLIADLCGVVAGDGDPWSTFRGELLRRIAAHGVEEVELGRKSPDLVVALTWFLQQDPLKPIPTTWNAPTEPLVRAGTLGAVDRSEQWRPFQRWAVALGLARRTDTGSAKVLIPDATTAIADQLASMPASGSAKEWLSHLRDRLPILGSPALLAALPTGGPVWSELPPGLMLGLRKLESLGALRLEASDDASDVVSVGLASSARQIGRITVLRGADV